MHKLAAATTFLTIIGAWSASAQTPPTTEPKGPPPQGSMMGEGMKHSDNGCPMMKKMASLEDRLKKLEQSPPKP
jgi:hypothetical protein